MLTAKGQITAFKRTLKSFCIALNHMPKEIFSGNIVNIFSQFYRQKLNPFEGLAHAEN